MKSKKLKINQLKVKSFVMSIEPQNEKTIKGGSSAGCETINQPICYNETKWPVCQTAEA